jgi:lipid II:glycine glycyltransferase (peptidoglycan interpeptide bridge formation enzyme)
LQDFKGKEEDSPCFLEMETVRRYSVREAAKKGGKVVRANSGDTLVEFYRKLMQSQGESPSTVKLAGMQNVMDALLKSGRGAVYHVLNAAEVVVYSVFYGWDTKRAYYLFGAGNPEVSEPWQGTLAHWEAFKDLSQRSGIKKVDLEGVNSPKRGWFKLGFGGDLRPYYRVNKDALVD